VSYIQIWLIIKTAYLLEAFKPHVKIFEFKIVKVEISLTIAGSTISYNVLVIFALLAKIKVFLD